MPHASATFSPKHLEQRWSPAALLDQFILSRDASDLPAGWPVQQRDGWYLGSHPSLPVVTLTNPEGLPIGCLLGYIISPEGTMLHAGALRLPAEVCTPDAIEPWIYGHGGRFIAALLAPPYSRVYLDPTGSLSAVYCPPLEILAATPTLVPREGDTAELTDLNRVLGFPFRDGMYPVGLTPRKNVWRLLPNHYLDLRRFAAVRHWPRSDFRAGMSPQRLLDRIADRIAQQVGALTRWRPATVGLTAGYDSRTLLACARGHLHRLTFFTAEFGHPDEDAWLDGNTARAIAREHGLPYFRLKFRPPEPRDLEGWIVRTGNSAGEVRGWRASTTYKHLPPGHIDLITTVVDAMHHHQWSADDYPHTAAITPDRLVAECGTGPHPLAMQAAAAWLDGLPTTDPALTLDIFYFEQRLGCWGGVTAYAYGDEERTEMYPMNHRDIIEAVVELPYAGRLTARFQETLIEQRWPELLKYPFNTPTRRQRVGLATYRARWALPTMPRRAVQYGNSSGVCTD